MRGEIFQPQSYPTGMRNRIVNGDMRIDQANGGAAVSVNAFGPFNSVDKWRAFGTGAAGAFSLQQLSATPPNGFTNYLRATVTTAEAVPAAASLYYLYHKVEGTYCQDLQFGIAANTQSVVLSFVVRSSVAGTYSGALRNSSGNRSYVFQFTINAANTWETKSIAIAADASGTWLTTPGVGLDLGIDLGSGANSRNATSGWQASAIIGATGTTQLIATNAATFDITGVQLEPGVVATPFEQRPLGDMLRLCQREFCKSFSVATAPVVNLGVNTGDHIFMAGIAGATAQFSRIYFPTAMRAGPTITTYNSSAANGQVRDLTAAADCSGTATFNNSDNGFSVSCTGAAGTTVGGRLSLHWTADARL